MKKMLLTASLLFSGMLSFSQTLCESGMAGVYPCRNVDLMAFMSREQLGGDLNSNTNDIWGWVSPVTGKEYALVGCSNGTAFVDLSEPAQPVYLGLLPTHSSNSLWRDLEAYNNYCFIVSEADDHGLQVFDLLQLDTVDNTPVTFEESAHYDGFSNCHTLNINQATGFVYCNGTNTYQGGLHIVDINDPLNPSLAGGFAVGGYTHDCYVWSYDGPDADWIGKELVFACNEDDVMVVDVTDKSDCQSIGSYDYNGQTELGYIHQGWITKDKKHFLVDDELDEMQLGNDDIPYGTRTHMFDITDIDELVYEGYYEGSSMSIDHNLYVHDQFVYESNYRSGVRILDAVHVADAQLSEVGYFDLYPNNDFAQFSGTWSNYPYLPSGINIATSMYDGIFILRPTLITLDQDNWTLCGNDEIIFNVDINAELAFPLTFGVNNLSGVSVIADQAQDQGTYTVTLSGLGNLSPGNYEPKLLLITEFGEQYEVPFKISVSFSLGDVPALLEVPNGSQISNTVESTLFTWSAIQNSVAYVYELAADAAFSSIIETQNLDVTSYLLNFDLPDGTYFWRVRGTNGCGPGPWSETFQFTILTVGIGETSRDAIEIYPNPVGESLNISFTDEINEIAIVDMTGRVLLVEKQMKGNKMTLVTAGLSPGIYHLRVNGITVARFIRK